MVTPIAKTRLEGTVTAFQGNGRRLGYPTANICIKTSLADGVYFGFADLDAYHRNPALVFIGKPVTVGETTRRVEAHLLDCPDRDYYDLDLVLDVEVFYRPNQKFASPKELVEAIQADERAGRQWFKENV